MLTHLDHVGTAVVDLAAAHATFTRLGFRLTRISHHAGSIEPGQPIQPWGSANHCAMLRRGYLELLGITDAKLFNPVEFMLAKYAGPHIVALSSPDAEAAYRELKERVDYVTPPRALGRKTAYGPEQDEERPVSFKLVGLGRDNLPEARFQMTEHLTPGEMWQPWLLDHPNGVVALTAAHIVSADPVASADRLRVLLDVPVEPLPEAGRRVLLEESAIHFHTRAGWESLTGRRLDKPVPAVVGIGLKVASLRASGDFLRAADIDVVARDAMLRIPAPLACGAELILAE